MHFENRWKRLAERLLVLQTRISHYALAEGGKDKTERCHKQEIGCIYVNNVGPWNVITDFATTVPRDQLSLVLVWYSNARPKGNLGSARKTAGPSP